LVSDLDDFLAAVLPRQHEADTALHRGDSAPRKAFWSDREPVTVLGAARSAGNRAELEGLFDWLAGRFSNGEPTQFEVIAAGTSGDLGYVVGYEHTTVSVVGGPPETYELRVTLIFRRENGEWRAVHRHADPRSEGQPAVEKLRSL
jgi:ketosteroid isomerase-like protein